MGVNPACLFSAAFIWISFFSYCDILIFTFSLLCNTLCFVNRIDITDDIKYANMLTNYWVWSIVQKAVSSLWEQKQSHFVHVAENDMLLAHENIWKLFSLIISFTRIRINRYLNKPIYDYYTFLYILTHFKHGISRFSGLIILNVSN